MAAAVHAVAIPHKVTLIPSHLPAGTLLRMRPALPSVTHTCMLGPTEELTCGQLKYQVCNKEESAGVRELVALKLQVRDEPHDGAILFQTRQSDTLSLVKVVTYV